MPPRNNFQINDTRVFRIEGRDKEKEDKNVDIKDYIDNRIKKLRNIQDKATTEQSRGLYSVLIFELREVRKRLE